MGPTSFTTWRDKPLTKVPNPVRRFRHGIISFYSRYTTSWQKINGYHSGVMWCAWISGSFLTINTIATIWCSATFGMEGGLGTIQDGSCTITKKLGFWLHLVINVLSTLLLGASNYSMQCLSSPTRAEIDKAQQRNQWLDIGVPSLGNLRRISASRITLWWLLAASSIPLHLFYNSAVFSSLYSRGYDVYVVSSDFPAADSFNHNQTDIGQDKLSRFQRLRTNMTLLQKLDNRACLEAYAVSINSNRADVLLVSSYNSSNAESPSNSGLSPYFQILPGFTGTDGFKVNDDTAGRWICNDPNSCDLTKSASTGSSQLFREYDVQYCLSEQVEAHCKVQFSIAIMIFVICCNFMKLVCMIWIVRKRDSEPLFTLGDAIASFLDTPDHMTLNACLAGKDDLCNNSVQGQPFVRSWEMAPIACAPRSRFWFSAASEQRWGVCNGLWVLL